MMLALPVLLLLLVLGISLGDHDNECISERIWLSNPSYVEQQLHQLRSEISQLKSTEAKTRVVYTRWGRQVCPQNVSTLVYAGYVGGSAYDDEGGAADYVCLPPDPTWGPFKYFQYTSDLAGHMYGAEYERPGQMFGVSDTNEEIPCAVCESVPYSATLMIPGRANCYPTWTEAYHGNLVSGHHKHKSATQYICMDGEPTKIAGGGLSDDNSKLAYGVKTVCGSLPCPPYENDTFLSCVVCLK